MNCRQTFAYLHQGQTPSIRSAETWSRSKGRDTTCCPVWTIETDSSPIGVTRGNCFLHGRVNMMRSVTIYRASDMSAISVRATRAVEILINYGSILVNLPHWETLFRIAISAITESSVATWIHRPITAIRETCPQRRNSQRTFVALIRTSDASSATTLPHPWLK